MAFHPYLFFGGTCRQAFTRYQEIFGGDLTLLPMSEAPSDAPAPPGAADLVMHAALAFDGHLLMGSDSDDPSPDFGSVDRISVTYSVADPDEARRAFDALAEGGRVTVPMGGTFWSPAFGMCVDSFGVSWMVSTDPVDGPAGGA